MAISDLITIKNDYASTGAGVKITEFMTQLITELGQVDTNNDKIDALDGKIDALESRVEALEV